MIGGTEWSSVWLAVLKISNADIFRYWNFIYFFTHNCIFDMYTEHLLFYREKSYGFIFVLRNKNMFCHLEHLLRWFRTCVLKRACKPYRSTMNKIEWGNYKCIQGFWLPKEDAFLSCAYFWLSTDLLLFHIRKDPGKDHLQKFILPVFFHENPRSELFFKDLLFLFAEADKILGVHGRPLSPKPLKEKYYWTFLQSLPKKKVEWLQFLRH